MSIVNQQDVKQIWQNKDPSIQHLGQGELRDDIGPNEAPTSSKSKYTIFHTYLYMSCKWAAYAELWSISLSLAILNPWKNQHK